MKPKLYCLFFLCLSFSLSAQVVTEGLIAKYYFNEANTQDDVGTNHGVNFGATLTEDRFGNEAHAFHFGEDYIRIDHNSDLDLGSDDFSISCWFRTMVNNQFMDIFNKGEGTAVVPRIFIRTMQSPPSTIQWRVGDGFTNFTESHTDTSLFNNNWHHAVLVKKDNALKMYIDAELVNEIVEMQLPFINTNSSRPILIGAQDSVFSGNVPFGNYFDGDLDDFRIYNRSLNDLEVDTLYNEGNPVVVLANENLESTALTVFPNPAEDYIVLKVTGQQVIDEVALIDVLGRTVLSEYYNGQIDVSDLPAGVYFIQIFVDGIETPFVKTIYLE